MSAMCCTELAAGCAGVDKTYTVLALVKLIVSWIEEISDE